MLQVTVLFIFSTLMATGLAWFSYARYYTVSLLIGLLVIGYIAFTSILSHPKPMVLELFESVEEVQVIQYVFDEGNYIYLLLRWEAEPRLYSIPWDRDIAQQLQNAAQEAAARGLSSLMMRRPFDSIEDDVPRFYAPPQSDTSPIKPLR